MRTFTGICLCIFFTLVLARAAYASVDTLALQKNMVITRSTVIKKAIYALNADPTSGRPVIEIKGNDIVVDFNGAVLLGSTNTSRPDKFYGTAVHIAAGSNVTFRNAVIRGYKIALLADSVSNLKIENCNFSYNYRQHLNSNREREDLSDWQSYHRNEKDEWMRFGAGMYLRDCDNLKINGNQITGGQCALMMVRCNEGFVSNNDFSFNSGIGIGFYRSSYNQVLHNSLDWNVRGVSYGVYYRGQDAAAILVYEQSSHNIFAYNSATHSGDGFFLWAGESTLETGKGGCNDNLIYGNDFSYAPTNGVETTFSRNKIIRNKIYDCDYGIWAGYSHQTVILGNDFRNNQKGVAIEQGQDNQIIGNFFHGEKMGVQLWAVPGRAKQKHYDDHRDVRSMRYNLYENSFHGVGSAFVVRHSTGLRIAGNHLVDTRELIQLDSASQNIVIDLNDTTRITRKAHPRGLEFAPEVAPEIKNIPPPSVAYSGKQYIMMTEWGPYDFRSPILWPVKKDSGIIQFSVFGPQGEWKILKLEGVDSLSKSAGTVPGTLTAYTQVGRTVDIQLAFKGDEVVSPFGKKYSDGSTYPFGFTDFYLPIRWEAKLFAFDDTNDPLHHPKMFKDLTERHTPLKQLIVDRLDNRIWDFSRDKLPTTKIATVATGQAYFPKGRYVIGLSAGELGRVYLDGKLIIDAWNPAEIVFDADYHHEVVVNLKGRHVLRVEQAQYGGYGMLYLTVRPDRDYRY